MPEPPYPLQKMNHRKDAFLEWLVANPHLPLKDAATALGYTPEWVRRVFWTDLFQARYKERCEELQQVATHTFNDRILGIGALALDVTEERLMERRTDPMTGEDTPACSDRVLIDTTKNTLQALGYLDRVREPEQSTHLHLHVDADSLQKARERSESRTEVIEV